jgi:hypothetical protein
MQSMKDYKQPVTDSRGDNASYIAEYQYESQLIEEIRHMPINGIKPTAEHQRICQQLARNMQVNKDFSRP